MDIGQRVRIARILVLTELVIAVTSVVESTAVAAVGFASPLAPVPTVVAAVLLAVAARSLGAGRPARLAKGLQIAFLAMAGVDLVVAAFVGAAPLLVPTLVRIVVPVAVLVLLRRAPVVPATAPVLAAAAGVPR